MAINLISNIVPKNNAFNDIVAAANSGIEDAGNFYTGTTVEAALQEIGGGTSLLLPYLKLDQTSPQTTTGTFIFPNLKINTQQLGSPTYSTLGDWFNTIQSSGRISGMVLSAHSPANGTLDISSGTGIIKTTDALGAVTKFFDYAGESGIVLTDNQLNYIYAYYDSGTGTVKVAATTDRNTIHSYDQFTLGRCYRENTNSTDITVSGTNIYNSYRNIHNMLVKRFGFAWASGSTLSESGTRGLHVTSGVWYIGNTEIDTAVHDTISGTGSPYGFDLYYYNPTTALWVVSTGNTTLGNSQYNDISSGTGLASITANKWANYWIYQCTAGDLYVLYGQAKYNTSAEAQATQSPGLLPNYISSNTRLIARITIQNGTTNFNFISNSLITPMYSSSVSNHNNLGGLQGGTTSEYYHLTSAQATIATQAATGSVNGYLTSTDWTTFNNKQTALTNPVTGTGTSGIIPKFTGTSTIGDSSITEGTTIDFSTKKLTGGTYRSSYLPTLDLSGEASFAAVDFKYPNNGIFKAGEISIAGTNDVFFQAQPGTSSGYGYLEAWTAAGLILGTGNNASAPVQIKPNRSLCMQFLGKKMSGGTNFTTYAPTLDMSGESSFASINLTYPANGIWKFAEISLVGTNDIFLQTQPATTSGYGYVEAWTAAGLILGTGNNASAPIIFKPNRTETVRFIPGGNCSFGIGASPTAIIHIKAGTATAGTAPMKFTSGTLLTNPEVGSIEFLADSYYATITTSTERKKIVLATNTVTTTINESTNGYVLKYNSSTKTWVGAAEGTGFSWAGTPATETAAGTAGDVAYDQNFMYVCTTTGTTGNAIWKRATLNSWTTYGITGTLLQEDGYLLLQEDGNKILIEGII
jgi:hypothetical protein